MRRESAAHVAHEESLLILLTALLSTASAAGLDLLEVGGAWGTPGTTDATALWWNPAGLAAGHGTRFTLEAAPTFATVNINRTNPNYAYDPNGFGPEEYDYGGLSQYKTTAVVPYLGVVSDFGLDGLGIGIGLAVPQGKSAAGSAEAPTRYHLIEGGNQALYLMAGGAYEIKDRVSFGFTGAYVDSSYASDLYSEAGTALNDGLKESFDRSDSFYSDTMIEDDRYASRVSTDGDLKGSAITFGAGVRVKAHEKVAIAVAYRHGLRVDNRGTAKLDFSCPSTDDIFGRAGAQIQGICDADLTAQMTVGYNLPGRVQAGVVVTPTDKVRLEAMGGYVFWSVFKDYEIDIAVDPASVPKDTPEQRADTAALISQTKTWARDQQNSFWFGIDGKFDVHERVMLGGRVLYDKAAVPTDVLSPNNYDANTVSLTGLIVGKVLPQLQIGLSATQYIAQTREVTNSAFGVTMAEDKKDVRYFYPSMNGTFGSSITRIGISLRGQFDHGKSKPGTGS